jgi:hypothetical protein
MCRDFLMGPVATRSAQVGSSLKILAKSLESVYSRGTASDKLLSHDHWRIVDGR